MACGARQDLVAGPLEKVHALWCVQQAAAAHLKGFLLLTELGVLLRIGVVRLMTCTVQAIRKCHTQYSASGSQRNYIGEDQQQS